MLIQNVWLHGARVDLRIEAGRITSLRTRNALTADNIAESPLTAPLTPRPGEVVLEGGTVCPPLAEPHVHLDAALLGRRAPNRSGTLVEGIENWARLRPSLTLEDVRSRATETTRWYVGYGATRLRTHVDTGSRVAAEALLALRDELAQGVPGLEAVDLETGERGPVPVDLQIVAFPQQGILRAPGRRQAWEDVVRMGVDAVGAIPHHERTTDEGWRSVRMTLDLAEELDLMVDLHCDETDDPGSRNLEVLCAEAIDRDFGARIVAGHCTAMHSYPEPHAAKVIGLVVESQVQVVCNPLDNIVLQGRYGGYPKIRGLTRVDELLRAGAIVGIGHDSVVDPWYRLGTANLVDVAYMVVHAGHLTGEQEMVDVFDLLSGANHRPWGGPPVLEEGAVADLTWYPADDPIEVLRLRPRPRVFVGGREVVAV
jgi:cytosine/creatinine deaminase